MSLRSLQIQIAQGMFDLRGWIEQEHRGPSGAACLWGRFSPCLCTCGKCHKPAPSAYRRDGCSAPLMALVVSKVILSEIT